MDWVFKRLFTFKMSTVHGLQSTVVQCSLKTKSRHTSPIGAKDMERWVKPFAHNPLLSQRPTKFSTKFHHVNCSGVGFLRDFSRSNVDSPRLTVHSSSVFLENRVPPHQPHRGERHGALGEALRSLQTSTVHGLQSTVVQCSGRLFTNHFSPITAHCQLPTIQHHLIARFLRLLITDRLFTNSLFLVRCSLFDVSSSHHPPHPCLRVASAKQGLSPYREPPHLQAPTSRRVNQLTNPLKTALRLLFTFNQSINQFAKFIYLSIL